MLRPPPSAVYAEEVEPAPEWAMSLPMEFEQEDDGRWLAEVPDLPGVLAYGATRDEAGAAALALALRVLAERAEHGEPLPSAARGRADRI